MQGFMLTKDTKMVTMREAPKFTNIQEWVVLPEEGAFIKDNFYAKGATVLLDPLETKYLVPNGVIGKPGDQSLSPAETRAEATTFEEWLKELNHAFITQSTMNAKQAREYVAQKPDHWRDVHRTGIQAADAVAADIKGWKVK